MKKLHELALELKNNNFEMSDRIKEKFEDFLSIIAKDSRILHPRFGLGTVTGTQGNILVTVEFDRDIEELEFKNKLNRNNTGHYYSYSRPYRAVHITSCTSIHMLIKKEKQREIMNDMKPS